MPVFPAPWRDAQKKTAHAAEQDRPDIAARRQAWFDAQPDLDPDRLVFIDESGTSTKMARTYGRALRGERCRAPVPHGHWKTTTLIAALGCDGIRCSTTVDGAIYLDLTLLAQEGSPSPVRP